MPLLTNKKVADCLKNPNLPVKKLPTALVNFANKLVDADRGDLGDHNCSATDSAMALPI